MTSLLIGCGNLGTIILKGFSLSKKKIIVLEKDKESFPVEQIQIDKEDFIQWFQKDASNIANETVQSIKKKLIKNKEPQIFIYYMRSKGTGLINIGNDRRKTIDTN